MTDVQANYLKTKAPESKKTFIDILRRISQFSHLSEELFQQLFEYSNFVCLVDKERPVQEGTFGQNIYVLIQGQLEVYLQTDSGEEKQTDVIFRPFSIFGEQCILGEPNNASVEARGEVLLLAIDMSALPDLFEGLENAENRLEDEAYRQSLDMNTIFATVLLNRLNRLIKDQYKLVQKLLILHQSKEYQASWRQNVLLTTIFNEFSQNNLSPKLEANQILQKVLDSFVPQNQRLNELISQPQVNTEKIYMELVKLESLGKIDNMNILLMETIQRLAEKAMELDDYTDDLELELHNPSSIVSLSGYLDEVFQAIVSSCVLSRDLTKEQFLEGFLSESYPEPAQLTAYLEKGGFITGTFEMAYLMVLICQSCIRKEFELNHLIAESIAYLTTLNTPRQNVKRLSQKFREDNQTLTSELIELYQKTAGDETKQVQEGSSKSSAQDNVENLLAEFDL
ncbi:MAG: cyclic nucleotide-binding domain-containing protein [Deltaproteobacteria bacterium]|nr:cyclic nucleotide-binding domain-containing protein [Deltaproteobacteria bacterium]